MNGARKTRKSVPISEAVVVNTREVNVTVEGLDPGAIAGSFAVHLAKNDRRIASRFFFQASDGADAAQPGPPPQLVHFDFVLPIDVVADGHVVLVQVQRVRQRQRLIVQHVDIALKLPCPGP